MELRDFIEALEMLDMSEGLEPRSALSNLQVTTELLKAKTQSSSNGQKNCCTVNKSTSGGLRMKQLLKDCYIKRSMKRLLRGVFNQLVI